MVISLSSSEIVFKVSLESSVILSRLMHARNSYAEGLERNEAMGKKLR